MGTVAVLIGVGGDNLTSFLWAGTGMCAAQEHMHPIFRLARAPASALQGCPPAGSQSHPCRPIRAGWRAWRAVAVVPSRLQGAPPGSAAAACRPASWAVVHPPLSHPPPFGLRQASISDSALRYALFFAFFLGHLVFCGWSAVAPPILNSWSHTGWYSAYNSIWPRNRGAGRGPGRGCGRRLHTTVVCRCMHLPWPRCPSLAARQRRCPTSAPPAVRPPTPSSNPTPPWPLLRRHYLLRGSCPVERGVPVVLLDAQARVQQLQGQGPGRAAGQAGGGGGRHRAHCIFGRLTGAGRCARGSPAVWLEGLLVQQIFQKGCGVMRD